MTNLGTTGTSPPSTVSVYVAADVFLPAIINWPDGNIPSLAPGQSHDFDRTLTIYHTGVTGNYLIFYVDMNDAIQEVDETNNYTGWILTD